MMEVSYALCVYDRGQEAFLQDLAGFVLAGGKSTRMGRDKAFVEFEGKTLLARALEVTRSVTADVWIAGDAAKFGIYASVVEDVFRGCGPLGGIHAALRASRERLNLMLAVDVPFVSREFLQFLIVQARESNAVVTVVEVQEKRQPLCAVYRREFVDRAEKALRAGRYKINALFEAETTRVIRENELSAAGFSAGMFRNLNTPEELVKASRNSGTRDSSTA
jgi:molybdenum cofactor guanylyltransferase